MKHLLLPLQTFDALKYPIPMSISFWKRKEPVTSIFYFARRWKNLLGRSAASTLWAVVASGSWQFQDWRYFVSSVLISNHMECKWQRCNKFPNGITKASKLSLKMSHTLLHLRWPPRQLQRGQLLDEFWKCDPQNQSVVLQRTSRQVEKRPAAKWWGTAGRDLTLQALQEYRIAENIGK